MSTTVYVIGLIVAVGMILFNIDDVIWILFISSVLNGRERRKITRRDVGRFTS